MSEQEKDLEIKYLKEKIDSLEKSCAILQDEVEFLYRVIDKERS